MSNRFLFVLAAIISLHLAGNCRADDSIWRFGFYWSITATTYPPKKVPWSKYTHISQFAILPTPSCGIDARTYMVDRVQTDLVRTAHHNQVKILITLLQDKAQSAMARCTAPDRIAGFVAKVAEYVARNNYDGVDIDWEHGVVPNQYQDLVRKLRGALPDTILTADVAVQQRNFIAEVQGYLNRVNLMNYDMNQTDYHGSRLKATWHQAALSSAGGQPDFKSGQANVEYLLSAKIAPSKINYGVPFYGYAIAACKEGHQHGSQCSEMINRPAQAIGARGSSIMQVTYSQIVKYLATNGVQWDASSKASYIQFHAAQAPSCSKPFCGKDAFVTFSDVRAVSEVVDYLLAARLGGIMTFALHQEYMNDQLGDNRYPLSSAIYARLARTDSL